MGRRRTSRNRHLPKHVYRKGAGFIYRRDGRDTYLCKQTAPMNELYAALARISEPSDLGTLDWLLAEYFQRKTFEVDRTRSEYENYSRQIREFKTAAGARFGDVRLEQITRRSIRGYLDKYPSPVSANRQVQFLKAAWNLVAEFHDIPDNPCMGVRLNAEEARTRYVTQEEFTAFKASASGYIPLFMELGYLLRARWSEVQRLSPADLLDEGVRLTRSKGSEGEITAWTPRLRQAVDDCRAFNAGAPTPIERAALIHDKRGRPISRNAFQSAWGRAMRAWSAQGGERFTYHDLKAAGVTDQRDNFGGHRSPSMRQVYVRKLQVVQPPE